MKVVLLQNVKKVGQKGEVKEVAEGFARNHLIPQNLAKEATAQVLREVAKLSQDKVVHNASVVAKIAEEFKTISNQNFSFQLRANEKGALFAKFEEKNFIEYIHKQGYKHIELKHVHITESPIKHTGSYTVVFKEGKLTSSCTITISK